VKVLADVETIDSWGETCSLRAAEDGGRQITEVAALLNVSVATVQHLEHDALLRVRRGLRRPRQPARPEPVQVAPPAPPPLAPSPPPAQASPEPAAPARQEPRPAVRRVRKRSPQPQPLRQADPARGARLRAQLEKHQITQLDLAELLDLSQALVNHLCTGRRDASPAVARALALLFGTTSWFFLAPAAGAEPLAFQEGKPAAGAP